MRRRIVYWILGLPLAGLVLLTSPVSAQLEPAAAMPERLRVTGVDYLGQALLPAGLLFEGTEVGGLSALAYDPATGHYYALSDDHGAVNPSRFYTLTIDIANGFLSNAGVVVTGVTMLSDAGGAPLAQGVLDPEGLALAGDRLYVSSEGPRSSPPLVAAFGLDGRQLATLPLPDKFLPNAAGTRGVRDNLAFEGLTARPDGRLFAATENALAQDGPAAGVAQPSASRILTFDLASGQPAGEYVYLTEPVAETPDPPDGERLAGLAELLALDGSGTFLVLERSFSAGEGFTVRLFAAQTQGALDVAALDDLIWDETGTLYDIDAPVGKQLLADLGELGLPLVTNFEGMAFGPVLDDGRQTLLLVADNNFNPLLPTQFVALALTLETVPTARPSLESPRLDDQAEPPVDSLPGAAAVPAIWVHPDDPAASLVVAAIRGGGLHLMDLSGRVLQTIAPPSYGQQDFTGVDLLYGFPLAGHKVDVAVVADSANDTLAVFRLDPDVRRLVDVTSPAMPGTIFGVDDGQQTAYRLATIISPRDGRAYAFVTQRGGNLVAQLALSDDGAGGVTAAVARQIELPTPTGDPAESQAAGLVADRVLGHLFVAMEQQVGLLRYSAEPDGGDEYDDLIHGFDDAVLPPNSGGLTIYYGPGQSGYLMVSSRGNNTYALFDRGGEFAFCGRFAVGDGPDGDGVAASAGLAVVNVALGDALPAGLLVVQDGLDSPQQLVEDGGRLSSEATNFKYLSWASVAGAFPEPLLSDTEKFDPRRPFVVIMPTVWGK